MLDCSSFKELSGLRSQDLQEDEREMLRQHIEECAMCRAEQAVDEELLSLVDRWPAVESGITAADIRRMDGLEEAAEPVAAPAPSPTRPRSRRAWWPLAVAAAAVVLLALLVVPRAMDREETQRFKGATPDTAEPVSLDLQFSVETRQGSASWVVPGRDAAAYDAADGLIFGVQSEAPTGILLAEEGPDGAIQLIGPSETAQWRTGDDGTLVLVDGAGRQLSYKPDGPAGTYRYTAILPARPDQPLDPAALESLVRGDVTDEGTVLASDSFAIEWMAGDDGGEIR